MTHPENETMADSQTEPQVIAFGIVELRRNPLETEMPFYIVSKTGGKTMEIEPLMSMTEEQALKDTELLA